MYGCESWTINKAECQIIDVFELWCWRFLSIPWTARRSNQSILKEISPEYSLEGLMLRLKLQYFGHLMRRADSFEKTLMLGKIEGRRIRGWQRMRCSIASLTQWTWVWVNSASWQWTGRPDMPQFMGSQRDMTEQLNWTLATRLLHPWDPPDKNTGVGSNFLLWRIFPNLGSNPCLLHWQVDSLPLSHQKSPIRRLTANRIIKYSANQCSHWKPDQPKPRKSPEWQIC